VIFEKSSGDARVILWALPALEQQGLNCDTARFDLGRIN